MIPSGGKIDKPNDPSKAENAFGGWYADDQYSQEFDFTAAITKNTTVYVKWIPSWTVTINMNNGTTPDTKTVSVGKGEVMSKPENPVIAGLYFDGWFTEATGGTEVDFTAAVTTDKTIYAHWETPDKYYEFTMTLNKKRMALRYSGEEGYKINPKKGDVITFKFQCPEGKMFDRLYLRNYAGSGQVFVKNDDKSINGFISGPDKDGWYTFQYVFGDKLWNGNDAEYPISGFLLEPIYNGYFAKDDVVKIYGFAYNGEELVIHNDHTKGIRSDETGGAGDDAKPTMEIKDLVLSN